MGFSTAGEVFNFRFALLVLLALFGGVSIIASGTSSVHVAAKISSTSCWDSFLPLPVTVMTAVGVDGGILSSSNLETNWGALPTKSLNSFDSSFAL